MNEQEKVACVNALMQEGYDLESAVYLVKEAADYGDAASASLKASGRTALEGIGGGVVGTLLGSAIAKNKLIGGFIGGTLGGALGAAHGMPASYRNSLNKHEIDAGGEGSHGFVS